MQTKHKRAVKALSTSALALGMIVALDANAQATSGIASTRHNLGSSNRTASGNTTPNTNIRPGDIYTTGVAEICVFCHTPHASVASDAPLWNKTITSSGASYIMYSSGTMQGTASFAGNTNMSLACLSCHDGTQAMDNMPNMPSSNSSAGWDNSGTQRLPGTWWAGTEDAEATGNTINGALNAAAYMELGTDLSNDHPVGIPYCGGGLNASGVGTCSDSDFNAVSPGPNAYSFVVGTNATMKSNMRLYNTAGVLTVECGSCHDPHNTTNTSFLRISNSESAVCLTCHVK